MAASTPLSEPSNTIKLRRLDRVTRLIQGLATPYGFELLPSIHCAPTHAQPPSEDAQHVVNGLAAWNARKLRMFIPAPSDRLASGN